MDHRAVNSHLQSTVKVYTSEIASAATPELPAATVLPSSLGTRPPVNHHEIVSVIPPRALALCLSVIRRPWP